MAQQIVAFCKNSYFEANKAINCTGDYATGGLNPSILWIILARRMNCRSDLCLLKNTTTGIADGDRYRCSNFV